MIETICFMPQEIKAIQYLETDTSAFEIIDFFNKYKPSNVSNFEYIVGNKTALKMNLTNHSIILRQNNWLVYKDSSFIVYSDAEFKHTFAKQDQLKKLYVLVSRSLSCGSECVLGVYDSDEKANDTLKEKRKCNPEIYFFIMDYNLNQTYTSKFEN